MTENIEKLILEHLRHIRGMVDRLGNRVDDLTRRMGGMETNLAQVRITLAEQSGRMDRLADRVEQIERRLDRTEVDRFEARLNEVKS